jgi:ribonuclease HI
MDNATNPPCPEAPGFQVSKHSPEMKDQIEIWIDGSCRPNPGIGGYAAILRNSKGKEITISGAEIETTSNRMELMAAICALERLSRPFRVTIHLDSEYVSLGITQRLPEWKASGWRTSSGKPVLNADLWKRLETVVQRHQVDWQWQRGHAGDVMNERAHRLANAARERCW